MADYITPEEVPSAGSLENILGFDALDKWAKMPGSTLAKASDLAVTDGKVTAAQEAAETAQEAAETAQTAANTATEKATQAVVAANSVTGDITKIWGRMREIYTPELTETHDYAVSALWFYNGLAVPTSDEFPTNTAVAYDSVFIPTGNGASEVKLHVKGLSYAEDAIFSVVVMCQKLTLYAENTELGYLTRDAGDKTFGWLCFSVRIVQGGIFAITEMANCTFTLTYAGTTYSILVPPAIPSVDSALSGSSENPVQNKVVTAALYAKAPLASPAFTGTPTAPTAAYTDASERIANTGFVKASEGAARFVANNQWVYNEQLINSSDSFVFNCLLKNTPGSFITAHMYFVATGTTKTIAIGGAGSQKTISFTGLNNGAAYMLNLYCNIASTSAKRLFYTLSECGYMAL